MAQVFIRAWVLSTLCGIRFIRQNSWAAVRSGLGLIHQQHSAFLGPRRLFPEGGVEVLPSVKFKDPVLHSVGSVLVASHGVGSCFAFSLMPEGGDRIDLHC